MTAYIDPSRKVLRHPSVLAALRRGETVWPVHVEVDLSNQCNLACRWCDFAHTHDGALMPIPLAVRALRELADGGTMAVTFSGAGEPTMHPGFAGIVNFAAGLGLDVGVYTNGIEAQALGFCIESLSWVYVSIDAASPGEYEAAKGVDAFDLVLGNIGRLHRRRPGLVIGAGFLLDGENWVRHQEMADVGLGAGATYVQFRPMIGADDYGWVGEALPVLDAAASDSVLVSSRRFRDTLGFERHYEVCRGSMLCPCIGARGWVWVCPNTRGLRLLGHLATDSFATIWSRRPEQRVGDDCRIACRNHDLNETLEYVCGEGPHDNFV